MVWGYILCPECWADPAQMCDSADKSHACEGECIHVDGNREGAKLLR